MKENKGILKSLIHQISPNNGPWFEVTQLLWSCNAAFNESAATARKAEMPANHIARISHMLCDECVVACLIPLSTSIMADERPAMLDQQKATGRSKSEAAY
jgi:hypothetical protein